MPRGVRTLLGQIYQAGRARVTTLMKWQAKAWQLYTMSLSFRNDALELVH